jgi:hypothetical protein
MPPFAVEVHPLAADEAEAAESGTVTATRPRRRVFDASSIEA